MLINNFNGKIQSIKKFIEISKLEIVIIIKKAIFVIYNESDEMEMEKEKNIHCG
jgi:hypothetical protein